MVGVWWNNLPGFSFLPPIICGNDFVVFFPAPNKISCLLFWTFFVWTFHSQCYFFLCCQLPLVLVVVGGPFILVYYVWMLYFGSFETILPIPLQWLMPWRLPWYYIPHSLAHFMGGFMLLVCCCLILGRGKNSHLLWCVPLVLRCRMNLKRYVGSSRLYYILSLCLNVTHFNSIAMLSVLLFIFLVFLYRHQEVQWH